MRAPAKAGTVLTKQTSGKFRDKINLPSVRLVQSPMCIFRSLVLTVLIAASCRALPLSFEQRDSKHFLARVGNGTVEFHPDHLILSDVSLRFLGASGTARLEGLGPA